MSNQEFQDEVSSQPRQASLSSSRTRRPKHQPLAKVRPTPTATSTFRSSSAPGPREQHLQMAMSTPSGPHHRHSRRRSSVPFHDHVRNGAMNSNQAGRPLFTKTGRVSKAKKGLKVHECDQCGKVYSRAEHLRRHQYNHRTSPLCCRTCGRQFFRDDLLVRHKDKYGHHGDAMQVASMDHETMSLRSSVEVERDPSTTPSARHDYPAVANEESGRPLNTRSRTERYIPFSFNQGAGTDCEFSYISSSRSSEDNLIYSARPVPSFPRDPIEPHIYSQSPSPAVTSSWIPIISSSGATTIESIDPQQYVPHWDLSGISSLQSPVSNSPPIWDHPVYFEGDMANFNGSSRSSPAPVSAVPPMLMSFTGRDMDDPAQDGHLGAILSKERQHVYIQAYWRSFHPFFPILHKQRLQKGNKLHGRGFLLAAMMAIGAQFTHELFAGSDSRILHERASADMKKKKLELSPSTPLEIMQTIVLLEFLSHFKAKRAPDGLSELFKGVYNYLRQCHMSNHQSKTALDGLADVAYLSEDMVQQQWHQWIEIHCRERLLSACFILDSRHALLLARQNYYPALSGLDLYIPVCSSLWEASTMGQWTQKIRAQRIPTLTVVEWLDGVEFSKDVSLEPYPSALLIACYAASTNCQLYDFNSCFASPSHPLFEASKFNILSRALSAHASIQIMALVVQLISLTPFRALIATSGESWFFSKRLARDTKSAAEEFERLQHQMRAWTTPSPTHSAFVGIEPMPLPASSGFVEAVDISLRIVREATLAPEAHLTLAFGPELALYFASLVLWAATFAGLSHAGRSPMKAEDDSDPFEWEPRRAEQLVTEFIPLAFSDIQSQGMAGAPSPPHAIPSPPPAMTQNLPVMAPPVSALYTPHPQQVLATPVSSPHNLPSVLAAHPPLIATALPPRVPPQSKLSFWRMGVGAILRWSAFVISGAGHRNSGAGELVEGAIGVLEKVGRSGWVGPWF